MLFCCVHGWMDGLMCEWTCVVCVCQSFAHKMITFRKKFECEHWKNVLTSSQLRSMQKVLCFYWVPLYSTHSVNVKCHNSIEVWTLNSHFAKHNVVWVVQWVFFFCTIYSSIVKFEVRSFENSGSLVNFIEHSLSVSCPLIWTHIWLFGRFGRDVHEQSNQS